MTVQTEMSPATENPSTETQAPASPKTGMSPIKKVGLLAGGIYLLGFVVIIAAFGLGGKKNEDYHIVEPFHPDT